MNVNYKYLIVLPSIRSHLIILLFPQYGYDRDSAASESEGIAARLSTLFIQAGNDDIRIVEKLVTSHEIQYKSISFGEDVIKEMIMSSVFGIPVSAKVIITFRIFRCLRIPFF